MVKNLVSVIIPTRNEIFIQKTVESLLARAKGDIEIIVIVDGYWPNPPIVASDKVRIIHFGSARGMRPGINAGVAASNGEYILKLDGHCLLDEGFDTKLVADCADDWVVVPRRKRLDAENWRIQDVGKPDIDYMYVSYPEDPKDFGGPGLNGKVWAEKNADEKLKSILIDDLLSFQGSAWFMKRNYFDYLELMDSEKYGTFWNEAQEIGFKCWLSGGRVVVNKKTWYAHLHKGKKYGRGYTLQEDQLQKGARYTNNWLRGKIWHKQIYELPWLINKFWPVPGWPEDKYLWISQKKESRLAKLWRG